MAAVNPGAAQGVLNTLPGAKAGVIEVGNNITLRLAAFMEALDYTVTRASDPTRSLMPLKEKMESEEELKSQKELQGVEAAEWDEKFKSRKRK
jgi:hypothetical protein